MRFIIPYKSKKENPHAGETSFEYCVGSPTITVVFNKPVDKIDTNILHLVAIENNLYTYITYSPIELSRFQDSIVSLSQVNRTQTIHTLSPQGQYLYEYDEEFEVQCEYCKIKFRWGQLEDEYIDDYYMENMCPACEASDCCELEFEK